MGKFAYLHVDLKTTSPDRHSCDIWSAAWTMDVVQEDWSIKAGQSKNAILRHGSRATTWVFANTDYLKYFTYDGDRKAPKTQVELPRDFILRLAVLIKSVKCPVYLVGANVGGFDAIILERYAQKHLGESLSHHYRTIDVESMAMGYFNGHVSGNLFGRDNGSPYLGPASFNQEDNLSKPNGSSAAAKAFGITSEYEHTAVGGRDRQRALFYTMLGVTPVPE